MTGKIISASSRRQFLFKALPAGTLFCLGCRNLSGSPGIFGRSQLRPKNTNSRKMRG